MIVRINSTNGGLRGFGYFWGKRITGFNPRVHCARCLVGDYLEEIGLSMPANTDVDVPLAEGDIVYICGVAKPYKWINNAHLALRVKAGTGAVLELYTGDRLEVVGAERIPFDGRAASLRYGHLRKAYTTCRNFQFGASYFGADDGRHDGQNELDFS